MSYDHPNEAGKKEFQTVVSVKLQKGYKVVPLPFYIGVSFDVNTKKIKISDVFVWTIFINVRNHHYSCVQVRIKPTNCVTTYHSISERHPGSYARFDIEVTEINNALDFSITLKCEKTTFRIIKGFLAKMLHTQK